MPSYVIHIWQRAPFLRLLLFLISGILLQDLFHPAQQLWYPVIGISITGLTLFYFLPAFRRYKFSFVTGLAVATNFAALGALLTSQQDIRNNKKWFGHHYNPTDTLIVSLDEPLVEKNKSFKADATVHYLLQNGKPRPIKGKIIIYFKKDSSLANLSYGSGIIFKKTLQEIRSSGNPGSFDFKRYCFFLGITHQVYLQQGDYAILPTRQIKWLNQFIFHCREWVLNVLRTYIKGEKELGLAEALLIGYKDDLDKTLVQAYTNTGVVHVIAISGLHLGIIYLLLSLLFRFLQRQRLGLLRAALIITGLWLFTLLAGAQPSVLRSAVMFTCIVLGESAGRRSSIYNTLAFSAFLLLCYNPFWLWNIGFQLSYVAVLSIVIFMRPVYNLFYCKNKLLDAIWKLNAVTLAAQILTTPLSIYHFHQFPNYFLLTNCVAIPLSSIILIGEILLSVLSFSPLPASISGELLSWLIRLMNTYIESINAIPYSVWSGLQINLAQLVLLFVMIACLSYWLINQIKVALKRAILVLLSFAALRSHSFIQSKRQAIIIVYNVPQQSAIDLIAGRDFAFFGDSSILSNQMAFNFHLNPSRIKYRLQTSAATPALSIQQHAIRFHSKNILLVNNNMKYSSAIKDKPILDLLIISHSPRLYLNNLARAFMIKQVVFDASNSFRKLAAWKRDCDSLGIPYHDVAINGAFVMRLQ